MWWPAVKQSATVSMKLISNPRRHTLHGRYLPVEMTSHKSRLMGGLPSPHGTNWIIWYSSYIINFHLYVLIVASWLPDLTVLRYSCTISLWGGWREEGEWRLTSIQDSATYMEINLIVVLERKKSPRVHLIHLYSDMPSKYRATKLC